MGTIATDATYYLSKVANNAKELNKNSEKITDPTIFISDAITISTLDEILDSTERLNSDEETRLPKQKLKVWPMD